MTVSPPSHPRPRHRASVPGPRSRSGSNPTCPGRITRTLDVHYVCLSVNLGKVDVKFIIFHVFCELRDRPYFFTRFFRNWPCNRPPPPPPTKHTHPLSHLLTHSHPLSHLLTHPHPSPPGPVSIEWKITNTNHLFIDYYNSSLSMRDDTIHINTYLEHAPPTKLLWMHVEQTLMIKTHTCLCIRNPMLWRRLYFEVTLGTHW
jgi:hypothetical protein